jgi:hypothetical protein
MTGSTAPSPSRLARIDARIDEVMRAKWMAEEREAENHEKYELVWERRALAEIPIYTHVYEQRSGIEFAKWCGSGVIWKWRRDRMPEEVVKVSGQELFWFID